MKAITQSYFTGQLETLDTATPTSAPCSTLLVHTDASLVSVGTEKAMIDVARKSSGELGSRCERVAMLTEMPELGS